MKKQSFSFYLLFKRTVLMFDIFQYLCNFEHPALDMSEQSLSNSLKNKG